MITHAADIETIPVCSYTVWVRQLSYTQLIEELSRLREYLNSVIEPINNEYLMSVFMDSYTTDRDPETTRQGPTSEHAPALEEENNA